MIRATEANLARVTDKTIIVPGHGSVGTRADLAEFRDMLVTVRDKVVALKARGMSLEEVVAGPAVVAAKPTARYDAKWGQFVFTPDLFTGLIYAGV